MNLRSMEVFCRVVKKGVMARAADELQMTPAAVSRCITELEEALGKKLLSRTTRKMSVTPEGRHYYEQAIQILDGFHKLHDEFETLTSEKKGNVKIAAPMSYGLVQLGPIVSSFKQKYPDVTIEVLLQDSITDIVEQGYDLAIRIRRNMKSTSLIGRKIQEFNHHIVASPERLKGLGKIKTPDDLKKVPCLAYSGSSTPNKWKLQFRKKKYTHTFKPEITVNNSQFLIELAKKGRGVCMVPTFLAKEPLGKGELVELFPDYEKPRACCWLVYPSRKFQRPIVQDFIHHFIETSSKIVKE